MRETIAPSYGVSILRELPQATNLTACLLWEFFDSLLHTDCRKSVHVLIAFSLLTDLGNESNLREKASLADQPIYFPIRLVISTRLKRARRRTTEGKKIYYTV